MAEKELVQLLNEALVPIRKPFGMHGQIQWRIVEIDPEAVHVDIWTRRKVRGSDTAFNVRNALLGYLRDVLPCPKIRITFRQPDLGIEETQEFPFVYRAQALQSSAILLEENIAPKRERLRPLVARLWREEVARS